MPANAAFSKRSGMNSWKQKHLCLTYLWKSSSPPRFFKALWDKLLKAKTSVSKFPLEILLPHPPRHTQTSLSWTNLSFALVLCYSLWDKRGNCSWIGQFVAWTDTYRSMVCDTGFGWGGCGWGDWQPGTKDRKQTWHAAYNSSFSVPTGLVQYLQGKLLLLWYKQMALFGHGVEGFLISICVCSHWFQYPNPNPPPRPIHFITWKQNINLHN